MIKLTKGIDIKKYQRVCKIDFNKRIKLPANYLIKEVAAV